MKTWLKKHLVYLTALLLICCMLLVMILKQIQEKTSLSLDLHTGTSASEYETILQSDESREKLTKQRSQDASIFVNIKGEIIIPQNDILDTLDIRDLQEIYHRYVETIQKRCRRQLHLGNELDGGYHVCEDAEVAPGDPCLVYSFGIRRDFSFDDGVSKTFGCEVHSFDPGDGQKDHRHSTSVWFHNFGIGSSNTDVKPNWKLRTLGTIREALGHETSRLDILKVDVEGAEWSSLAEMVKTNSIKDVKQLLVELHIHTRFLNLTSRSDYISHLTLLRDLYELEFRIFYFRQWNPFPFKDADGIFRTGCHEVHFMRDH